MLIAEVFEIVEDSDVRIINSTGALMDDTAEDQEGVLPISPIGMIQDDPVRLVGHGRLAEGLSTISLNLPDTTGLVCTVQLTKGGWLFIRIGKIELHVRHDSYAASRLPKIERATQ